MRLDGKQNFRELVNVRKGWRENQVVWFYMQVPPELWSSDLETTTRAPGRNAHAQDFISARSTCQNPMSQAGDGTMNMTWTLTS